MLPPDAVECLEHRHSEVFFASSGIAYEYEESAPDVACVASAIRVEDGPPVAAVSASGWIAKVDIRRVGLAVRTTALSIARGAHQRRGWKPSTVSTDDSGLAVSRFGNEVSHLMTNLGVDAWSAVGGPRHRWGSPGCGWGESEG